MGSALPDPTHYTQLSHHSLHQPQKSESSLVGSSAPWDMDNMVQPIRGFTGAPGYQSGNSHSGIPFTSPMNTARIHTHNKTVYSEFLSPTDEFQNPWLCHVCLCCQVWTWSRSICVRSVRCVNVWRTPSGPTRGWDSSWRLVWLTPPEMEVRETKEFLSIMMRLWNSWSSSSSPNLW